MPTVLPSAGKRFIAAIRQHRAFVLLRRSEGDDRCAGHSWRDDYAMASTGDLAMQNQANRTCPDNCQVRIAQSIIRNRP